MNDKRERQHELGVDSCFNARRPVHGDVRAPGTNEATPAEAGGGPTATTGATAAAVDWTATAIAPAPTRLGGHEDSAAGRLPTGPVAAAVVAAVIAVPLFLPAPTRR